MSADYIVTIGTVSEKTKTLNVFESFTVFSPPHYLVSSTKPIDASRALTKEEKDEAEGGTVFELTVQNVKTGAAASAAKETGSCVLSFQEMSKNKLNKVRK